MCDTKEENITHFLECSKYGQKKIEIKDVFTQNTENQLSITERVEERMIERKEKNRGGPGLPLTWLQSSDHCCRALLE